MTPSTNSPPALPGTVTPAGLPSLRFTVRSHVPPIAFGLVSILLGTTSLLLFFLPILGIPLAVLALLSGLVGLVLALFTRLGGLRWSLAGLAVSGVALGINLA